MAIRKRTDFRDLLDRYFTDLKEELERWGETLMEAPSWDTKTCEMEPLHDMKVTPTEVVVTMDLPFTTENKVQVKPVDINTLEISAEMKRKVDLSEFGITHYQGEFKKFYCQSHIPVPVRMDKMKINFKKGILEIHLPRKHKR